MTTENTYGAPAGLGAPQRTIHGDAAVCAAEHNTPPSGRAIPSLWHTVCPACGAAGPHPVGPGRGPHYAEVKCRQCGRWVKWLPRPRRGASHECLA